MFQHLWKIHKMIFSKTNVKLTWLAFQNWSVLKKSELLPSKTQFFKKKKTITPRILSKKKITSIFLHLVINKKLQWLRNYKEKKINKENWFIILAKSKGMRKRNYVYVFQINTYKKFKKKRWKLIFVRDYCELNQIMDESNQKKN